ncbi:MAG TPA: adenylate/guanylate cyclase domain-containing protein [Acidimicrobiales bacterium]|nr:adenylate/guanylate cyclase domain-containing protein [Acidimicrobiales bacterium]
MDVPPVSYADTGAGLVGYQVFGDGPVDVCIVGGLYGSIDSCWDVPGLARVRRFFAGFARVIHLDYRGTGVSDPLPGEWSIEAWATDVAAVLDAAGSTSVALWGEHVGAHVGARYVIDHPDRVRSMCFLNTGARFTPADDGSYDLGLPADLLDGWTRHVRKHWGSGRVFRTLVPDADGQVLDVGRHERRIGSPSVIAALTEATMASDARDLLPLVRVPSLVVHTGDVVIDVAQAEDLVERLPDARLTVVESTSLYWGEAHAELSMRWLVGEDVQLEETDLVTVLFTDVVASTDRAAELGDAAWRRELDALDAFVSTEIRRRGGRLVKQTGDGHLVELRGPSEAVRLAMALVAGSASLGMPIRVGLHTGEIVRRGEDIAGIAVHAGARILDLAASGEILVSRTVRDLTAGSGFTFVPRGAHTLRGLDDGWELFAVSR